MHPMQDYYFLKVFHKYYNFICTPICTKKFILAKSGCYIVAVSLVAHGIHNHIRLTRMIVNLKIIVLDQLHPSSLPHVQISLSKKVLQALVVGEDMSHIPKKIMMSGTQGMNHSGQFKIMSGIVLFMRVHLM
jgi:hypothetical protein